MITGLLHIHESLDPLLVDIDQIGQFPNNPRAGDIEVIAESMELNGMYRPVYVQRSTGHILGGNHTYAAALSLGATKIPVVYLDVDDATARRIVAVDNRSADLGQYDNALLVELLTGLDEQDSLLGTGYTKMDLEMLQTILDLPPTYEDFASWPTLTLTVPPHLKNAFYEFTDHAVSDHERLELLLRLGGWRPKSEEKK